MKFGSNRKIYTIKMRLSLQVKICFLILPATIYGPCQIETSASILWPLGEMLQLKTWKWEFYIKMMGEVGLFANGYSHSTVYTHLNIAAHNSWHTCLLLFLLTNSTLLQQCWVLGCGEASPWLAVFHCVCVLIQVCFYCFYYLGSLCWKTKPLPIRHLLQCHKTIDIWPIESGPVTVTATVVGHTPTSNWASIMLSLLSCICSTVYALIGWIIFWLSAFPWCTEYFLFTHLSVLNHTCY